MADVETLFLANEDEALAQLNEGLDNFKEIDTVVFLGPVSFQYFVKATKSIPFWQQKTLTTFDLTKQIADYMLAGKVKVAIDQQPYLQGFYAVTNAALWNKYMVRPMGPIIGPRLSLHLSYRVYIMKLAPLARAIALLLFSLSVWTQPIFAAQNETTMQSMLASCR